MNEAAPCDKKWLWTFELPLMQRNGRVEREGWYESRWGRRDESADNDVEDGGQREDDEDNCWRVVNINDGQKNVAASLNHLRVYFCACFKLFAYGSLDFKL